MHQERHRATTLYPYLHHRFSSATSTQHRKSNSYSTIGYYYRHFCSLIEYYVFDCCTDVCCYKYSPRLHESFFNNLLLKCLKMHNSYSYSTKSTQKLWGACVFAHTHTHTKNEQQRRKHFHNLSRWKAVLQHRASWCCTIPTLNGSVEQQHYVQKQHQEELLHQTSTSWNEHAEEELHNADFFQI